MDYTQKSTFYLSGYACQACGTKQIDFSETQTPVPAQDCKQCLAKADQMKNEFNHLNIQTTTVQDLGVK